MSVEILLLAVLVGMTILAYMIAINAHGAVRLIFSFLFATIMLAGSVWAIVQHYNARVESMNVEQLRKLELEKRLVQEQLQTREQVLQESKDLINSASRMTALIAMGSGYASTLISTNLQDPNSDLDGLMARAADLKRKVDNLRSEINKEKEVADNFPEATALVKEAAQFLAESCYYHRIYYYSEDTAEEQSREQALRQRARIAQDKFQKASSMLLKASVKPGG